MRWVVLVLLVPLASAGPQVADFPVEDSPIAVCPGFDDDNDRFWDAPDDDGTDWDLGDEGRICFGGSDQDWFVTEILASEVLRINGDHRSPAGYTEVIFTDCAGAELHRMSVPYQDWWLAVGSSEDVTVCVGFTATAPAWHGFLDYTVGRFTVDCVAGDAGSGRDSAWSDPVRIEEGTFPACGIAAEGSKDFDAYVLDVEPGKWAIEVAGQPCGALDRTWAKKDAGCNTIVLQVAEQQPMTVRVEASGPYVVTVRPARPMCDPNPTVLVPGHPTTLCFDETNWDVEVPLVGVQAGDEVIITRTGDTFLPRILSPGGGWIGEAVADGQRAVLAWDAEYRAKLTSRLAVHGLATVTLQATTTDVEIGDWLHGPSQTVLSCDHLYAVAGRAMVNLDTGGVSESIRGRTVSGPAAGCTDHGPLIGDRDWTSDRIVFGTRTVAKLAHHDGFIMPGAHSLIPQDNGWWTVDTYSRELYRFDCATREVAMVAGGVTAAATDPAGNLWTLAPSGWTTAAGAALPPGPQQLLFAEDGRIYGPHDGRVVMFNGEAWMPVSGHFGANSLTWHDGILHAGGSVATLRFPGITGGQSIPVGCLPAFPDIHVERLHEIPPTVESPAGPVDQAAYRVYNVRVSNQGDWPLRFQSMLHLQVEDADYTEGWRSTASRLVDPLAPGESRDITFRVSHGLITTMPDGEHRLRLMHENYLDTQIGPGADEVTWTRYNSLVLARNP